MRNKRLSKVFFITFPLLSVGCTQGQGINSFPSPSKGEPIQSYLSRLTDSKPQNDAINGPRSFSVYHLHNMKDGHTGIAGFAKMVWIARYNSSIKDYCILNGMKYIKTTDDMIEVDRGIRCTGDQMELYSYVSPGLNELIVAEGIKGTDELLAFIAKNHGVSTLTEKEIEKANKYNKMESDANKIEDDLNSKMKIKDFINRRNLEFNRLVKNKTIEGTTMCHNIPGNLTEYAIITQTYTDNRVRIDVTKLIRRSQTTINTNGFSPRSEMVNLNYDKKWYFCKN